MNKRRVLLLLSLHNLIDLSQAPKPRVLFQEQLLLEVERGQTMAVIAKYVSGHRHQALNDV